MGSKKGFSAVLVSSGYGCLALLLLCLLREPMLVRGKFLAHVCVRVDCGCAWNVWRGRR